MTRSVCFLFCVYISTLFRVRVTVYGNTLVGGRFVPMHFRSRERNDHIVDVSFPGTKVPSNIRSHELSSPTTVALLGSRPTRYTPARAESVTETDIAIF